MSVVLRDLQVVMIGEILSMVGQVMLENIDKRLRDMFCNTKPFGGKSILAFGDFCRLHLCVVRHSSPLPLPIIQMVSLLYLYHQDLESVFCA